MVLLLMPHHIWCFLLPEILNPAGSEDKSPYRISISNDSDLKGRDTIEDTKDTKDTKVRIGTVN
jgi:hypothetical protein